MHYEETLLKNIDMLFLQGPHKIWKLITSGDNFLPPLGQLSVAAFLREKGFSVKAIDCCVYQWGFKTTEALLRKIDAPVIGISGPITWGEENLRLCRLIKSINPDCITIYGGPFVTLVPDRVIFPGSPIDFVVYGEGEITMFELLKELKKPKTQQDFSQIRGLVYLKNGHLFYTQPRSLIEDRKSVV